VLKGSEVKSIRKGDVNINEAYIIFKDCEAFILNMHIAKYDQSSIFNHDETATRRLLLNKKEIIKLTQARQVEGNTVIPLKIYLKQGLIKLELALAKGKKNYDKRQTLKDRDQQLHLKKVLKRY
jgi:SsrA-binding protein